MGEIEHPWNCPQGRPTMRHLINLNMLPASQLDWKLTASMKADKYRLCARRPCWRSKTINRFSFGKKFNFHANIFLFTPSIWPPWRHMKTLYRSYYLNPRGLWVYNTIKAKKKTWITACPYISFLMLLAQCLWWLFLVDNLVTRWPVWTLGGGSRGRARGTRPSPPPPLIFRSKWGPKGLKKVFGDRPLPCLRVWRTWPPLPLSQGLDPALTLAYWSSNTLLSQQEKILILINLIRLFIWSP